MAAGTISFENLALALFRPYGSRGTPSPLVNAQEKSICRDQGQRSEGIRNEQRTWDL